MTLRLFLRMLGALILLASPPALAGPPFVTDDPEPVGAHEWEVNYAISNTWEQRGASSTTPGIDINYGYSSDMQLHVQPGYTYAREDGGHEQGMENTEVGVKYRLLHRERDGREFSFSLYPMVQLPNGNPRLGDGSGRTQVFLPAWVQLDTGKWTIYGGGGYRVNRYPGGRHSWFAGGTALYQVSPRLSLGGEVFNETATARGATHTSGFNLGGIYGFSQRHALLFSAGRALNDVARTYRFSAYVGLQVNY